MVYLTGNQMWHTDSSFKQAPAKASLLSAREVPAEGGETEFASMRVAYGRLPPKLRGEIDELVVEHDFVYSRSKVGDGVVSPQHAALVEVEKHTHELFRSDLFSPEEVHPQPSFVRDFFRAARELDIAYPHLRVVAGGMMRDAVASSSHSQQVVEEIDTRVGLQWSPGVLLGDFRVLGWGSRDLK